MTSLINAARSRNVIRVRSSIAAGSDINEQTSNGETALYIASLAGYQDVVRELLSAKADVNLRNNYGETPIYIATKRGHKHIVVTLLKASADVNIATEYGHTPLQIACERGEIHLVNDFIAAQADVNMVDLKGQGSLYAAAEYGHNDVIEILLANGADLNAKDNNGHDKGERTFVFRKTALMAPTSEGHMTTVQVLLQHGADPDVVDKYGHNALYWTKEGFSGNNTLISQLLHSYMANKGNSSTTYLYIPPQDALSKPLPPVSIVVGVVVTIVILAAPIGLLLWFCKRKRVSKRKQQNTRNSMDTSRLTYLSCDENTSHYYAQIESRPTSIPQQYLTTQYLTDSTMQPDMFPDHTTISRRTRLCYTPVDRHDIESRFYDTLKPSPSMVFIPLYIPKDTTGDIEPPHETSKHQGGNKRYLKPVCHKGSPDNRGESNNSSVTRNDASYIEPMHPAYVNSSNEKDGYVKPISQGHLVNSKTKASENERSGTMGAISNEEPVHHRINKDGYTQLVRKQISRNGTAPDESYTKLENCDLQIEVHCEESCRIGGEDYLKPGTEMALQNDGYVKPNKVASAARISELGSSGKSKFEPIQQNMETILKVNPEVGSGPKSEGLMGSQNVNLHDNADSPKSSELDNTLAETSETDPFLELDHKKEVTLDEKDASLRSVTLGYKHRKNRKKESVLLGKCHNQSDEQDLNKVNSKSAGNQSKRDLATLAQVHQSDSMPRSVTDPNLFQTGRMDEERPLKRRNRYAKDESDEEVPKRLFPSWKAYYNRKRAHRQISHGRGMKRDNSQYSHRKTNL